MRHFHRWLVLACLLGMAVPVQAKSYSLDRIEVTADVRADGSMHVSEFRELTFHGTFHNFDRVLPLPAGTSLRNVVIADDRNTTYAQGGGGPGSYEITRSGNEAHLAWHYEATDETRGFTLQYDVTGAVVQHADVAELYWQFIEPQHAWRAEQSKVTITLPQPVPQSQIRVWAHGPVYGNAERRDGGVILTCDPLPANTLVEAHVLFPRDVIAGSARSDDRAVEQAVLAQEGEWADQANAQRVRARWGLGLPVLAALVGVVIWLALYWRFGREYHLDNAPEYVREPVEGWTPLQVGYLWRWGKLGPQDMTASLMDLVRRGALRLSIQKEEHPRLGGLLGTALEDEQYIERVPGFDGKLSDSEQYLVDHVLFNGSSQTQRISMDEFRETAKADREAAHARYEHWQDRAENECESVNLIDGKSSLARGAGVVVGGLTIAVSVLLTKDEPSVTSLFPAFLGGVMLLGNKALLRRNAGAAAALEQWQAFRRYLLDFSRLQEYPAPAVALWEQYLVYAISLGVAERVIQQFKALYPRLPEQDRSAASFFPHWTSSSGSPFSSMSSISDTFSSFSSSFSTAMSSVTSASGGGGGFSGGGGGGGGGGSSGAS